MLLLRAMRNVSPVENFTRHGSLGSIFLTINPAHRLRKHSTLAENRAVRAMQAMVGLRPRHRDRFTMRAP